MSSFLQKKAVTFFAIVLTALITCSSCNNIPSETTNSTCDSISEPQIKTDSKSDAEYFISESGIDKDKLFEIFYGKIKDGADECIISGLSQTNYKEVVEACIVLIQEHPEFFWIGNDFSTVLKSNGDLKFEFGGFDNSSSSERKEQIETFQNKIENITNNIDSSWDDYEKVLFIHDYLADNTIYDHDSENDEELMKKSISAYGCLVDGKAVCSGYTKAFKILADKIGIESGIVNGVSDNASHSWNYVKINDEYYWIDVTWDDPTVEEEMKTQKYTYFLFNDEILLKERTIDEKNIFVPKCSSLKEYYYVKNNMYFEKYNYDDIDTLLSAHPDEKSVSFMFSSQEEYNKCVEEIFKNSKLYQLSVISESGNQRVLYLLNDLYNEITIFLK